MQDFSTVKIELGIDARKIMQQVMIHNSQLEAQVEKGINLAMEEIVKEDDFVLKIKNETLKELSSIVRHAIMSYEIRNKLSKAIEEKIGDKINQYAEQMATKIVDALK